MFIMLHIPEALRPKVMPGLQPGWNRKILQHLPKILSQNGYYVAYPKSAQGYGEARTPTWVHQKRYSNTRRNSVILFLAYSITGLLVYSLYFLT